ncbi:MAG: hypothetical protein OEZ13_12940 [Spirochaetia bacterium]|nr:hypothetical protein [Spirochaetia bacterium]
MKKRIFLTLVLLIVFNAIQCGGENTEPEDDTPVIVTYESEGTVAAPIVLDYNTDLPYSGQVSGEIGNDYSYYQITGLTANIMYKIYLTGSTGDIYMSLYSAGDFSILNMLGSSYEVMTFTTSVSEIFIKTTHVSDPLSGETGAAYTINVEPVTITQEPLSSMPVTGTVDTTTVVYEISGIDSTLAYNVSLTNLTDNADLIVYGSTDFRLSVLGGSYLCSSEKDGIEDEMCTAKPTGSVLYVEVTGAATVNGSQFTLNVEPVAFTQIAFNADIPYSTTVDNSKSYFEITNLTPGYQYKILISEIIDDTALYIYADSGLKSLLRQWLIKGTGYRDFVHTSDSSLFIVSYAEFPTPFTINLLEISPTVTLNLSTDFPYSGTVGHGMNKYYVTGLTGGLSADVALTGFTDNLDLIVYEDNALILKLCDSLNLGTTDEACSAYSATSAGGAFYVLVSGENAVSTSDFTLNVTQFVP